MRERVNKYCFVNKLLILLNPKKIILFRERNIINDHRTQQIFMKYQYGYIFRSHEVETY